MSAKGTPHTAAEPLVALVTDIERAVREAAVSVLLDYHWGIPDPTDLEVRLVEEQAKVIAELALRYLDAMPPGGGGRG